MLLRILVLTFFMGVTVFSQVPGIEPGVSHDLAIWRAAHYSDVRYKLNLILEKMSPVLKGTIEIRVRVNDAGNKAETRPVGSVSPIILDWRKITGHEKDSTLSNVSINGITLEGRTGDAFKLEDNKHYFIADREHLIFGDGVKSGENVIKLDFTSPILTSGSAITRYVDKEDGGEYIYSLFVPSDASTAFPVFDQPDLKATFSLILEIPVEWKAVSNSNVGKLVATVNNDNFDSKTGWSGNRAEIYHFETTKPISTYVFAFAAGPFSQFAYQSGDTMKSADETYFKRPQGPDAFSMNVYVRKSQAEKFKAHRADVFRLTQEGIKYLETYFDYKFPFPKYDIVLIPEFPFGGMEHAGATFLREDRVIFPQEPTKSDYVSRALLIFHETAHQWFGDTVTMLWFDDLWLKEGFAEFMAYKTLEHVMPEANAWKVFYERNKQAAYLTDSTKGTTPIYQEIANLSAAKSAYGNIVYRKAPSFLRQAEFYLGEDKFQNAVRAFLKKHEFANAGWEDLVKEFETASAQDLKEWGKRWVTQRGLPIVRVDTGMETPTHYGIGLLPSDALGLGSVWQERLNTILVYSDEPRGDVRPLNIVVIDGRMVSPGLGGGSSEPRSRQFFFPNYGDYGYGIFLLDDKSRDYVLKNVGNEKDPFLRSMMWGSLWDSVREGELDPREYVELVVRNVQSAGFSPSERDKSRTLNPESDESTIATLLAHVSTAMNYYMPTDAERVSSPHVSKGSTQSQSNVEPSLTVGLRTRVENMLIDRMRQAPTLGLRITFYRALLNIASTDNARKVLKGMLKGGNMSGSEGVSAVRDAQAVDRKNTLPTGRVSARTDTLPAERAGSPRSDAIPLKTKDRFDIVTRLLILGDPDAPKLLDELIKSETSDEAKRYAYAAKAGIATAKNKAKYWTDYTANKDISESWIESSLGAFNSIKHSDLTLPYLERALAELPNLKRSRKIFFVNGWLAAFIGGQRSEEALAIVNKFLADNPNLDKDLRLKILENVDLIERAVKIRKNFSHE